MWEGGIKYSSLNCSSDLESHINDEVETHLINTNKKIKQIHIKPSKVNRWTTYEDSKLLELSAKFNYKSWKLIAEQLPGRTHIQCSARYRRIKPGIIKGSWTFTEDNSLLELVKVHGINWAAIAKYLPSRSSKQIRDRYLNILFPGANKEKFTEKEDNIILQQYKEIGGKWSIISNCLVNRSSESIKNRFYTSIRIKHLNIDYVRQKRIRERIQASNKIVEISTIKGKASVIRPKENFSSSSNLALSDSTAYMARQMKDHNTVKLIEKLEDSVNICRRNRAKSIINNLKRAIPTIENPDNFD